MDLGSLLFSRCVVMAFLLEAVHSSNGGQTSCSCREIPPWNLTEPPPKTESFNINETFRYKCIEGYVRKAGTSNLTRCKQKTINKAAVCEWWMPLPLQCIPDPKNPPSTTVTATTEKEGAISTPPPTLTNTEPSNERTDSHLFKFSSTTTTAITLAPLVIICAGIGVLCYIWRNKKNNRKGKRKTEEEMPMNPLP